MSKFFGILFILVNLIQFTYAEDKIAFIDVDKIIKESKYGQKSYKKIDDDFKNENKKLLATEKVLVSKEQEILKQKNILSEEELNKKIVELKKEISNFQNKRKLINDKFNKIRLDTTNKMFQSLNIILSKYAEDNEISLVIQKKYIVIAKSGLDITSEILKIFNEEIK